MAKAKEGKAGKREKKTADDQQDPSKKAKKAKKKDKKAAKKKTKPPKVVNGLNPEITDPHAAVPEDRRDKNPEYLVARADRIRKINENFARASKNGMIDFDAFRGNLGRHIHPFFAQRLFHLFDTDRDGRISIEEFQDKILRFETKADKMSLLFQIYDIKGSGELDKSEITEIFHAMVQESNLKLSEEEVGKLAGIFMKEAKEHDRVFNKKKVTKEAFTAMLLASKSLSDDVSTLIDHWIGFVDDESVSESPPSQEDLIIDMATVTPNRTPFNVCMALYIGAIAAMMILAGLVHQDARDKDGFANPFYITARVFGFPLNLMCTMVFVFMIHPIMDYCRECGWSRYLPLDHNLVFHMVSGYLILFFALVHTTAHFFNFKLNVQPDPENYFRQNNVSSTKEGWMIDHPSAGLISC